MTCFICAGNTCLGECELKIKAKDVSDLQQLLALKDLEIMRLREALHEIKYADDSAYYVCEKIAERALATPATYDDLMAWHNEQLGEPVAWQGLGICMLQPPKDNPQYFSPLYAKKV